MAIRVSCQIPAPDNEVGCEQRNDRLGAKDLGAKYIAQDRTIMMQIESKQLSLNKNQEIKTLPFVKI